jgi:hypothetical protein
MGKVALDDDGIVGRKRLLATLASQLYLRRHSCGRPPRVTRAPTVVDGALCPQDANGCGEQKSHPMPCDRIDVRALQESAREVHLLAELTRDCQTNGVPIVGRKEMAVEDLDLRLVLHQQGHDEGNEGAILERGGSFAGRDHADGNHADDGRLSRGRLAHARHDDAHADPHLPEIDVRGDPHLLPGQAQAAADGVDLTQDTDEYERKHLGEGSRRC